MNKPEAIAIIHFFSYAQAGFSALHSIFQVIFMADLIDDYAVDILAKTTPQGSHN